LDKDLAGFLERIYNAGVDHDSKVKIHSEQMLNITPDTGSFLSLLIQAVKARHVLEIGTSNGYSTIWLADAVRSGAEDGRVTTVEVNRKKVEVAKDNFEKCGLSSYIDLRIEDARLFLKNQKNESIDLLFLDAERPEYISYWSDIDRIIKTRGLLVVDNALAPKPEELIEFFRLVRESGRYLSQILRIGKGEMIALKRSSGETASELG
jgi:predicted O-methyltransferase YrrM